IPNAKPPDDQTLVKFLLDLLPLEEAERLDELSIADDDVAARLHTAEQDLVDAYVRGVLTSETLERFESHYMAAPIRRRRVELARKFVPALDRAAAKPDGLPGSRSTVVSMLKKFTSGPALWAAAAMLIVLGAAALLQTQRVGRAERERARLDARA